MSRSNPWAMIVLLCGTFCAAACGEQFTLLDESLTHGAKYKFRISPSKGAPTNWISPVDYLNGTIHFWLEVQAIKKPVLYRVCLNERNYSDERHALFHHKALTATKVGIYSGHMPVRRAIIGPNGWDWENVRDMWIMIMRGDQPGREAEGDAFYPLKVHVKAVVVSKGAEYTPHGTYGGLHHGELAELKDVAQMLEHGHLGAAFQAAERELEASVPARAAEARRVIEALRRHVARRRRELKALRTREPEWALQTLWQFAARYRGSEIGRSLDAVPLAWSQDDTFRKLVAARLLLSYIEERTRKLSRKTKGRSLSDPRRLRKYQHYVREIVQAERILATRYPGLTLFHQRASAAIARLDLPKR